MTQYLTADGRVIQMGMTRLDFWPEFMAEIGRAELAKDHRFTAATIYDNRAAAIAILNEILASRPRAEWFEVLGQLGRGWEIVQKASEVREDPAVVANGYVALVEGPGEAPPTPIIRNPVQFADTDLTIRCAPKLGADTDEILAELGLDWDEIVDLKVAGAVL